MASILDDSFSIENIDFNSNFVENGESLLSTICQKTSILPSEVLLLEAARENNVPQISTLIKARNVRVDVSDSMGRTACHWAAMNDNMEALESLIKYGADINRCDKYGMTPLLWAAWSGHPKIMIRLIKEDNECATQTNKQGMNILHCAASNDQSHVIEFIGECLIGFKFQGKNQNGLSALHISCSKGFKDSTDVLLKFSSEHINVKDNFGRSALHYSCKNGHLECVKKLMCADADVEVQDNLGQTPLHYAAHFNQYDVVRILMEILTSDGMNRVTHKQQSALTLAANQGNIEVAEILLRYPQVEVNTQDENGNTACHLSSRKIPGNVKLMTLLLETERCDVNLKNQSLQIPLHVAIEDSQAEVVNLLIRAGSSINCKNKGGRRPLDLALRSDEIAIVDLIIQAERITTLTNDEHYFQKKIGKCFMGGRKLKETFEVKQLQNFNQPADELQRRLENLSERQRLGDVDDDVTMNSLDCDDVRDICQVTTPLDTIEEESESRIREVSMEMKDFDEDSTSMNCEDDNMVLIRKIFWRVSHKHMKHDEWRKLAKHWNFESRHIKAIEQQYSTSHKHRNQGYRLLMIWFQCFQELNHQENVTKELYEAFVAIGNTKLAEKIRKKLNNDSTKNCSLS